MPRPTKEDPRDHFKTFRFSEAELARLEAHARASGRSISAYVRMVLFQASEAEIASPAMHERVERAPVAVRLVAEQMRRVGVNLNQIAARLNERKHPVPPELPTVVREIQSYVRKVREP